MQMEACDSILEELDTPVVFFDNTNKLIYSNRSAELVVSNGLINHLLSLKTGFGITDATYESVEYESEVYSIKLKSLSDSGYYYIIKNKTDLFKKDKEFAALENLAWIGEISAGLAHDMKNSLQMIDGFVKLSSKIIETEEFEAKKIITYLDIVRDASIQLLGIASNFLNTNKYNELSLEEVSIPDFIKTVQKIISNYTEGINFNVKLDFEGNIEVDKVKLQQILINLLKNSCESLKEKDNEDKILCLNVYEKDDMLCFKIQDNGIGIKPENLSDLFQNCFTTKKNGHGFGLSHSLKLAKQHKGNLYCDYSDTNKTVFTLEIYKYL